MLNCVRYEYLYFHVRDAVPMLVYYWPLSATAGQHLTNIGDLSYLLFLMRSSTYSVVLYLLISE